MPRVRLRGGERNETRRVHNVWIRKNGRSESPRRKDQKEEVTKLNFPTYKFRVTRGEEGALRIWDGLRRAWLCLTPEEWVRQNLIRFLVEECGARQPLIAQEYPVSLGGMDQRADVAVFDASGRVVLLAECKAPTVPIDEAVFAQAVRYNSVVRARYLVVTNGLRHFVRELMPDGSYTALEGFPVI